MTPSPSLFLYLKLGIVALAVAGVFVLAAMGRIDATTALGSVVILVTGLSVALGISASGSAQAQVTKAAAMVAGSSAPAANSNAGERGFGRVRLLCALAVIGLVALLAACLIPPSPAQQITDGEALDACITANWGQPVETVAATCLNSEIPTAIDLIADIEAIVELAAPAAANSSPYASEPRVTALVPAKLAALKAKRVVPSHAEVERARRLARAYTAQAL